MIVGKKFHFGLFNFTSEKILKETIIFVLHAKQPHCECLILIQSWKLECQLNDYVNFLESEVESTNYWPLCLQLTSELFNSLRCFHNKSPLAKRFVIQNSMRHLPWLRWEVKKADPAMNLWCSLCLEVLAVLCWLNPFVKTSIM